MLLPPNVEALIDLALEEDWGRGDVTSEAIFSVDDSCRARLVAKRPTVVAGLAVAARVFARVDERTRCEAVVRDGDALTAMQTIAEVVGPTRAVLAAERTALNFLQRASGIATLTRRFVDAVAGTRTRIVDTRKTAPAFRALDKAAVLAGGGGNHRVDLGSGVLIKDNHVAAAGGVKIAVERARAHAPHSLRIEVEVTNLQEVQDAVDARAEIILLDNMTPAQAAEAVRLIAGRALTEISGGITLDTVRAYAEAGADLISVGALTHSVTAADISLEF